MIVPTDDRRLSTADRVTATYHAVASEDLDAISLYAYRVGDGEHRSEWYQAEAIVENMK